MIIANGREYRNLEEQVLKNKNDITGIIEGERLLAQLGIKVVGQGETTEVLPDPVTYAGEYGDAYLIGTEKPYDFYIFTRPFEGELVAQWFNLGPFPVAGPEGPIGPEGPAGPQGTRGSQWFSGTGQPTTVSGYNQGDYYINIDTGNIWHLHFENYRLVWKLEGNITGPQGPQGERGPVGPRGAPGLKGAKGDPGPAGPIVNIIDILTSPDQLPDPASFTDRSAGYLITTATGHDVYIITGTEEEPMWENAGPFSAGTVVLQNGAAVQTFNADTKLDADQQLIPYIISIRPTNNSSSNRTYVRNAVTGQYDAQIWSCYLSTLVYLPADTELSQYQIIRYITALPVRGESHASTLSPAGSTLGLLSAVRVSSDQSILTLMLVAKANPSVYTILDVNTYDLIIQCRPYVA